MIMFGVHKPINRSAGRQWPAAARHRQTQRHSVDLPLIVERKSGSGSRTAVQSTSAIFSHFGSLLPRPLIHYTANDSVAGALAAYRVEPGADSFCRRVDHPKKIDLKVAGHIRDSFSGHFLSVFVG